MIAKEWIMRALIASFLLLSLIAQGSSVQAQGPFGRMGPGGFRPPMPPMMPPIPVPGVFPGPGYVRVPGVGPVGPAIVATPRPGYGYARSATIVAVPVLVPSVVSVPYSAARVAVVQPVPTVRSSQSQYQSPQATATARPNPSSGTNDLRPGMVLPDGAIVVSVGQPTTGSGQTGPTRSGQPSPNQSPVGGPQVYQPATILSGNTTPTPAPASDTNESIAPGTKSILENADSKKAEELPPPQPANGDAATNSKSRKF